MTPKLRLYRFIEDAWNGGVRDWCQRASARSLDGWKCWLIVANRGQARWHKHRSLHEGISSMGVRYLEPGMLRRELCALLGVEPLSLDGETLEFLLKVASLRHDDPESISVARNPTACLQAIDEIAAAGWADDVSAMESIPAAARDFFENLRQSKFWAPELGRELKKRAATKRLTCCVVGWDAANWREIDLLEAAARSSEECEVYLPMPRSSGEKLHQDWVEAVELRLGAARSFSNASGFESGNEALVERLEGAELRRGGGAQPEFLIGQEWRDELQLVRDHVISWLGSAEDGKRIAIVVPRRSPSSLQIVRALADAGVDLLDETGERQEAGLELQIQRQIIRYHLLACDVDALINLIVLLHQRAPGAAIDPVQTRDSLHRCFAKVQSRNARLIVNDSRQGSDDLRDLVAKLGRWEDDVTWSSARKQWETCLREFGMNTDALEPLWSQTVDLLDREKFPSRAFLEYLEALLSGTTLHSSAKSAYARVVVTTFSRAGNQTWDRIIFLDANEGVWPARQEENPFLDDAARTALNRRRSPEQGHLLLSFERSWIEQARFLDVVENCAGGIVFATSAREAADPSREAYPNEWAIRVLAEQGMHASWREQIHICDPEAPGISSDEKKHLKMVHDSRRDPFIPFDRYLFNFHESSYEASWWSATDLDAALTCPATFALKTIFEAGSSQSDAFERAEGWAVGILTHDWLVQVLGGGEAPARFEFPSDLEVRLEKERKKMEQHLAQLFTAEKLPLPLWWTSVLRKVVWVARNCVSSIRGAGGSLWFSMEKNVRADLETDGGPLKTKGRIDLLFADRENCAGAAVEVVDFKTGRAKKPTLAQLEKGSGFQFAAYLLMAKSLGASSVRVLLVNPERGKEEVFSDSDEENLRAQMGRLARLQRDLKFGQLGPLLAEWGAAESLPMATTPIDPRILEQKSNLLLIAQ